VKKNLLLPTALLITVAAVTLCSCLKPGVKAPVTLDKVAGRWYIHALRYKIYNGTSTPQDSTVPVRPIAGNYATFDGASGLKYCYNSAETSTGSYTLIGQDSIEINLNAEKTRWKITLLTSTNFNIQRESSNLHDFPGARVIQYQEFIP